MRPAPGLTLAVTAPSERGWTYTVAKTGKVTGGGRMVLVDDARAWVDLTWGPERPGLGAELVFVRQSGELPVPTANGRAATLRIRDGAWLGDLDSNQG